MPSIVPRNPLYGFRGIFHIQRNHPASFAGYQVKGSTQEVMEMEDSSIVELYWQRDQEAISHTQQKYGPYLFKIAYNILSNMEDSQESVNDTYWKAWGAMPPHRPQILSTFLGKITRQTAIDRLRRRLSQKRAGAEYPLCVEELNQCCSSAPSPQELVECEELAQALSRFLEDLSPAARRLFVGRYYFMDPLHEVAAYCGMSQSRAKSLLYRTRQRLRQFLQEEGFQV